MEFPWTDCVPAAASFGLALTLTPLVGTLARRAGVVARPRPDRWHQKPTALLGGVAIALAVGFSAWAFGIGRAAGAGVIAGAALLFAVGLVDDLRRLRPGYKLAAQLSAAGLAVCWGPRLHGTGWPAFDAALSVFWLVGITNALNLLDNMDGLAAGVAAIAAGFFAAFYGLGGHASSAALLLALAGALLGFLVYNFQPASIFMGDCGALFFGFLLGSAGLGMVSTNPVQPEWALAAVSLLVLSVPIFDTTFVTLTRLWSGRPISQGGRDHTSHRLVVRGWSERAAVVILYGISLASGLLALYSRELPPASAWLLVLICGGGYAGFAFYLLRPTK
jgi:UDP-GlcNAc:undecaprenyl-phosphate GlcNAc-1-phosphate transferase